MRFSKEDICYYDITWFAVDRFGRIMLFAAGNYGNIPEFVCESKENVDILSDYFDNEVKKITEIGKSKEYREADELITFAQKGIYCFAPYDGKNHTTNYTKILSPQKPLLISGLPEKITNLLSRNVLDVDVDIVDTVTVDNAYHYEVQLKSYATVLIHNKMIAEWFLDDISRSFDSKDKAQIKKIRRLLNSKKVISIDEKKRIEEMLGQIEIVKGYFEVITIDGEFVLYLVHKNDTIICGKGGLYSLQLYKKDNVIFDFNDKPGVWVEV